MIDQRGDDPDVLVRRVHDEMAAIIQRTSVAIVAYYDGEPRQHATGTLVRFADHWLLVTASHAIKDYLKGQSHYADLQLLLENGVSGLVPLFGQYWATETVRDSERFSLEDDLWDVAFWDLDQSTVNALTNKSFLNRTDISISADLGSGTFYLGGYPCKWAKADLDQRSMSFTGLGYIAGVQSCTDWIRDFDPRFHLALSLAPTEPMPQLEGISGCSIWKIADAPLESDWAVTSARVVAVQTGVFTKNQPGAVKGTKWSCVVRALGHKFPELRAAFNLRLPGRE